MELKLKKKNLSEENTCMYYVLWFGLCIMYNYPPNLTNHKASISDYVKKLLYSKSTI